ncbi:winged helix-turn-helix domain-containing protein [Leptolyngbya sp. CCNP1308]|uniref:winged helix-turn-helix domain-containing protein n=1 Tax=Leptolyngbya sp. CCNP1308 TaxID=3110255 RepID=UPI002B213042|nr:winged helix-turn-helix domain-containing protein [Leptolyngbya sp. CCNP1308]MEA5448646.1 winged helix-turn-helix domain-containing protein [Leptolyngbya sp. CCNP1308]
MPTIQDRLRQQAQQRFVGRGAELDILWRALDDDGPLVTFVSGLGGIGKSALLAAFVEQLQAQNITVLPLDCRAVEPSEQGVLEALGQLCKASFATVADVAAALDRLPAPVVITFDTYELFRLLDAWLRQGFVPALPDRVRLFFVGREAPVSAWLLTPGWQGLCQHLALDSLDTVAATALLRQAGVAPEQVEPITRFAHGHPLALKLAAAALAERPDLSMVELEGQPVVSELARIYLQDVRDPVTRQVLEAASVVRRTTRSLLAAMVPDVPESEARDRLLTLPFVAISQDGLMLHDMVQQAMGSFLQTTDPAKYQLYRSRAWQQLRQEWATAGQTHRWRYTADMLYLIEHRMVRDAFFPAGAHTLAMEPAKAEDGEGIVAITQLHEGKQAAVLLQDWWREVPTAFRAARDRNNDLVGYSLVFDPAEVSENLLLADPITKFWWQELQANPVPAGQRVFFIRRALGKLTGEAMSEIQAACWLDAKRLYLENLDTLRRVYIVFRSIDQQGPIVERLGFRSLGDGIELEGHHYYCYCLDFGPQQVMGWLSGLVDAQYGCPAESLATEPLTEASSSPDVFDVEGHALIIDGEPVPLTPLEYGVLAYLHSHSGKAVSRMTLLEEVWGYDYEGGSNVVDSIVRSLRKKLRDYSGAIATVTGVGYRFDGF